MRQFKYPLILVLSALWASGLHAEPQHSGASLVEPIQEIYPTLIGDKIWVAGGISSQLPVSQGQMTARVHYWSPGDSHWQSAPDLPQGRHHTYLQAVGDKLFALGGFINSESGQWFNTGDILMLSQSAAQWQHVATLPIPLSETVAAVIDGKIHLAGGRTPHSDKNGQWQHSHDTARHFVFDPDTFSVTEAAPLPSARNSAATVQIDGRWLILGGRQVGMPPMTDVLEYQSEQDTWRHLPSMPQPRAGHAATVNDHYVSVFGGEHAEGVYTDVLRYNTRTQQWHVQGQWPLARHGLGAISVGAQTWLIGGAQAVGLAKTSAQVNTAAEAVVVANEATSSTK